MGSAFYFGKKACPVETNKQNEAENSLIEIS
jgi:hypothetical protein